MKKIFILIYMMPYLTFKDRGGKPIGIIKGGKYKNKVIYINDSTDDDEKIPFDINNLIRDSVIKHNSSQKQRDILHKTNKIKKYLNSNKTPKISELKKIYNDVNNNLNTEITLYSGHIDPVPNPDKRDCIYISGPSGSGKSTYMGLYAKKFHRMFPKRKIYLFSSVVDPNDPLEKKYIKKVELNEELLEYPIEVPELENSLVLFDDTDTIRDKKMREEIIELKNDILQTGRHHNVYTIISSHLLTNYKETRCVLNECNQIVIFPSSGSAYGIKYCLKNYAGLDKKDIDKILKLPSRWVTIFKNFPMCVMYSTGAYLLK